MLVPLAEHFHSIQGEGQYTGLPMHFLRFPGCTVGKLQGQKLLGGGPFPTMHPAHFTVLPNGADAKVCTAYDGGNFFCDTDYAKHMEADHLSLLDETWETTLCFTGGEPLMHQGKQWFEALIRDWKGEIHVETSGTIEVDFAFDWLTVAPKNGWRPDTVGMADQIKFLVHQDTDPEDLLPIAAAARPDCTFYLSPIFDPNELVRANLEKCFELQKRWPDWRVGCQWHKFLGLR